jgi:transcriptional regulator with XRE-family HTH domain
VTTPHERFSSNLRGIRRAAGLSQEELSFRAAIHRTQVSLLEGGHRLPRTLTLIQLAGALEATPNDLLDGIVWEPIISISGGMVIAGLGDDADEGPGGS